MTAGDIVWSYAGVRPLYGDEAVAPAAATRDYALEVEDREGAAPLLNVLGGKITTYRRLAEAVLARLRPYLPDLPGPWTAGAALPGGDMPVGGGERLGHELMARWPFLGPTWARRLVRTYGTQAAALLGNARSVEDLGRPFGATLTAAEVRWLMRHEWAQKADDVLWRRTRLGLRLTRDEARRLDDWMQSQMHAAAEEAGR